MPAGRSPAPPLRPDHHRSMLCGPSCRVRRRARRRLPAVPLRCRAKVRPAAFLCCLPLFLSCPVGRYVPVSSRSILRHATVYHRRSYRHHGHRGSHSRLQSRSCRRRPGRGSRRGSRRSLRRPVAVGRRSTGRSRFLGVRLSCGKRGSAPHSLRRRFAGGWHAIRYYVREPPNVH
jgi:hypothetical protein